MCQIGFGEWRRKKVSRSLKGAAWGESARRRRGKQSASPGSLGAQTREFVRLATRGLCMKLLDGARFFTYYWWASGRTH